MQSIALAVSRHATEDFGPLRCIGHFRNAINLLTPGQQLLTLHREGRGLSPMGWEIADEDFDDFSDELVESPACELTPEGVVLADICLCPPEHRTDLHLSRTGQIATAPLDAMLAATTAETGLFGRLDRLITPPFNAEVLQMQQQFRGWLQGESVDWSSVLGKGPGLTPGNDDTVLGMLLCAWFDRRIDVPRLPAFFAASRPLDELTTLVSVNYLRFAAQGIFASPLQRFVAALSGEHSLPAAVDELLAIGHSSGVDTLLGIWSGARVINGLY
ncbi:DUF2877 domain-containing protein [Erwinia sp. JUb26]|uniref:DUF2877 domain-containing protein n=1 Tax=Erwinia sp. JUb26 TaxID=2485126 RepID=UPI000F476FD0|nr:DUF2877 domain-containing protein [Erwinia sp. JUb26]ROR06943.1 uncharacterized protein DUF2877 [Erwinia sp. JUb26]